MSDAAAAVDVRDAANKRDRSPSFPYIGLERAVDRARQLYNRARRYEVRLADAATAWGTAPKSSATLQTAAALLAFGLAEDSGAGQNRKIKISDLGFRILEDQRPGARERGLAEAALKPKLIADYAETWKEGRHDDSFCISELKVERGFTAEAATRFLRVFDETIQFASQPEPDKITDTEAGADRVNEPPPPPPTAVKVGDYVQWTSGGVDQFKLPKRVTWLSDDGSHAGVFGEMTGLPTGELTVVDPPKAGVTYTGKAAEQVARQRSASEPDKSPPAALEPSTLNVLLRGNRLEISADVDRAGLQKLKTILAKYEEILALLDPERE